MEERTFKTVVQDTDAPQLRQLAHRHGLRVATRGWVIQEALISGPADAVAGFMPDLRALQEEWNARDAW
ncbi:hypothetical protein HHL11_05675 [Ramlibacter sp. G-1-2-2]|uniref:Uncharacterized protein n=1 Tax=Ramlibacter agri TaxID=2728837 RepID=A0A848H274_9BURK|nr:hypothetical protein [Ramlibacter agri]NML43230.1 hypothetical protein [Ramlibacter agri]